MICFHRRLLPLLFLFGVAWGAPDEVDDRIALKGVVNGHPVKLVVDTGAGADILLWQTVTASLGLSTTPPPADLKLPPGQIPLGRTGATAVEIFGRTFSGIQISVVALPSFVPADSHGLIGWTAISQSRQAFSVAERRFTTVAELPAETEGWVRLVLRKESKVLELVTGSPSHREHVLVDTGSSDGIKLTPEKWRAWRAAHPRQPVTRMAYFNPLHGVVVGEESWDDDFVMEGIHFRGVAVASSAAVDLNYDGTPFSMIIGLRALERIDLVTDGPAGIALARSRPGPPAPYQHNRLGAVFTPRDASSDDLVAQVAEGTPAARAGVRQGDVLLAIDRLDVTPWRTQPGILPLSRFWAQAPGTKLVLRVRRDNRPVEIAVTLVNLLGPSPSGR